MIENPHILSSSDINNGVLLQLKIQAELSYFQGHFPAYPVVPGVVQLRWIESLARKFNLVDGEFQRVDKLKFMRVMSEDYEVELELSKPKPDTVQFKYSSEHGIHASGKMIFK